ncbi:MAG TPA: carboxypeptidase-like regulatory domain-containing protein [Pyrinomonadaceae bacterium]|jgi:hypothetical protein
MKTNRRIPPLFSKLLVLFVSFTVFGLSAHAQSNKGTIVGTVKDPSGALVKDARVTATNVATGETREATTNDEGTYTLTTLDPGVYRVSIDATGFQTAVVEEVKLETNARQAVDVNLTVAGVGGDTITVTAEAPLAETETSVRGDLVTGRQVVDLPLPQRNFTLLAALSPGVSRPAAGSLGGGGNFESGGPTAGTESTRFRESGGSVIVANGARPTNNNFTLDGVDNNETQFGQIAIFPSTEAIAEFKVETSVYSAESGRAGGAIISTTTKQGQNRVFGNLYEFYQGRFGSALPSRLTQPGVTFIPNTNTHNYGGIVGGPIFLPRPGEGTPHFYDGRNRSFFFFSYNAQRNATPAFNSIEDPVTVPTIRQRNGDFSEILQPGKLVTFNTVRGPVVAPAGTIFDRNGNPFPGNIIPSALFSPTAFRLLNSYPLPTDPGLERNYRRNRKERANIDGYDVRIDHNLIQGKNTLFGRYSKQQNSRVRDNNFPVGSSPTGIDLASGFGAGDEFGNSRQIALGDTHVFSSSAINDMRAGYHRVNIGIFNPGIGGALGFSPTASADLGIPNVNVCGIICEGTLLLGFAPSDQEKQLEFVGDGGPFFFNSNNFFFGDTLTLVRGSQTIRVGGDLRVRQNQRVDSNAAGGSKGNVQYGTGVSGFASGNYSGIPIGPNDAGSSVANFLLGNPPAFIVRGVAGGPFLQSNKEIAFFVQDDWKVNPNLTLNLGLRYDLFTLPTERYDRQSNFDPATGRLIRAGEGSPLGRDLGNADKNNFGPRVGFAYSGFRDDRKLVLRGGYGLLYALDVSTRPPLTNNPGFSASYSASINQFGTAGSSLPARFNLDTGYPFPVTGVPASDIYSPGNADATIYYLDPNNKTTLYHQYNLTLQREFGDAFLAEIAYVGALGRNLLIVNNIGRGTNGPGSREVTAFNSVITTRNIGESRYDSFQSKLERRFARGVSFISTYVWSHAIDNTSGAFAGLGNTGGNNFGFSNPLRPELDRGNSDFDIRHRFTFAGIWDLPFGRGRRYGTNWSDAAEFFFGGLQLNTNIQIQSGPPWTPRAGDTRVDLIGDPTPTEAQRARGLQVNPAAFRAPVSPIFASDPGGPKFGSLGRNVFRGERQEYFDASLFKNFRLLSVSETLNFQFRLQVFNVFNHVNRGTPVRDLNDSNFGIDTSEQRRRTLEYGLKIIF